MKTFLKLLLLFSVFGYLVFAVVRYSMAENPNVCQSVSIEISDSVHSNLVTAEGIEKTLRETHLYPVGVPMVDIDPLTIAHTLEKDSFIQHVLCVETPGDHVLIVINQRIPLLRVLADNGDDYFIDEKGTIMASADYKVDLAVATGHISRAFAKKQLREMGDFIRHSAFWNQQVEQIHVLKNGDVDIIMRVGEQVVHFGKVEDIELKFRKLYAFYTTIMPKVGWKRYAELNVAFSNQVIAKKNK